AAISGNGHEETQIVPIEHSTQRANVSGECALLEPSRDACSDRRNREWPVLYAMATGFRGSVAPSRQSASAVPLHGNAPTHSSVRRRLRRDGRAWPPKS